MLEGISLIETILDREFFHKYFPVLLTGMGVSFLRPGPWNHFKQGKEDIGILHRHILPKGAVFWGLELTFMKNLPHPVF